MDMDGLQDEIVRHIAGETVEIVPAQLGNTAGVIGASMLIES